MDEQRNLDESHFWMPDVCLDDLKAGWSHIFRTQVLPMIPEPAFATLYNCWDGASKLSSGQIGGLVGTEEMFDLTDEALMGSLRSDMRFHYGERNGNNAHDRMPPTMMSLPLGSMQIWINKNALLSMHGL